MARATIEVYGRNYTVACSPGQEERLRDLGQELDLRVSRIATAVGDVGDDRLLLIAALSLLDELYAARGGSLSELSRIEARAAEALEAAADMIEAITRRAEAPRDHDV